jgi:hypothetical protein
MTDPYLLLTPVLALAVLALARFVGCDWVFHLEELPPVPPGVPFVDSFVLGQPRTDPSDPPFTGWVGMAILVGAKPITVTQLGRIMLTASTAAHDVKLVQRAGNSGGIDLGTVTIPPSDPTQGFAYATLQPTVVLLANTEYYVVSHEDAMGDVWHDLDTTVTTTDVAQVTSSVFNDDNDNPDLGYQRPSGPGTTYGPVDFKYEEPA